MPSVKRLVIAGVVTFIAGLIVLFPARVAVQIASPPGIAAAGISGTVWRGSIRALDANGIYVGNLRWRSRPWLLLTGKFGFAVEATPTGGFLEADVAAGLGGTLYVDNLTGSLALAPLRDVIQVRGLQGTANLRIERLVVEDGFPLAADGTVEVAGLIVPLVAPVSIGGYRAEVSTQESGIVATVEETDGSFDLTGSLQLGADRSYRFLGQIAAKANTPEQARQGMRFLGTPNAQGQQELRFEGQL